MMAPLAIILAALLVQAAWCYNDEPYSDSETAPYFYPEDSPEDLPDDNEFDIGRRNNNFLRFGRGGARKREDSDYDENLQKFPRPTRSGHPQKNDYFIRFGRSKEDFLRFGRNNRDNYLRLGRSVENKRAKREAYSEFKRNNSNFLRFGRNSNFLRFGRNRQTDKNQLYSDSALVQLLSELIGNIKNNNKEQSKCNQSV